MNFTPKKETPPVEDPRKMYDVLEKYMVTDMVTLRPDQPIDEAIDLLLDKEISGACVIDEQRRVVGILTEKDCLRLVIDSAYDNFPYRTRTVRDYMSDEVRVISIDKDLIDVAYEFLNSHFRRFPVVHNGRLVGQMSRRDILRAARDIKRTTWEKKKQKV
jgi:CBS domain-containing protein